MDFGSNFYNHADIDFVIQVPGKTKKEAAYFLYDSNIPCINTLIGVNKIKNGMDLYECFKFYKVLFIEKLI